MMSNNTPTVIAWLNKEINEAQLAHQRRAGAHPSVLSFRPSDKVDFCFTSDLLQSLTKVALQKFPGTDVRPTAPFTSQ